MRPLWTMGLLLASGLFSWNGFAAPTITVNIAVYWEGRHLQDPNVDALERMRQAYPDIPLTHFVNPVYFLDEAKSVENIAAFQKVFAEHDEIGLYLAPIDTLVKKAGIILKLSPSFWGYVDESEVCEKDCGLDVPVTVYNREEIFRLFTAAHLTLRKAGVTDLQSFAVRGWLTAPFINQIAAAFGYRYDLSPVDPSLVTPKLNEFPISAWVQQRWGQLAHADPETVQNLAKSRPPVRLVPQRGGILQLNEQREILARFDRRVKERQENSSLDEVFSLSTSVETAFQSWPRLRVVLEGMNERAKKQKIKLHYATASGVKNSRPAALNMAISTRFSQPAEARK